MGLCQSNSNKLSHIDDSVKVMIRHDTKALQKKGQQPGGYVPRAAHPMLDGTPPPQQQQTGDGKWGDRKWKKRRAVGLGGNKKVCVRERECV